MAIIQKQNAKGYIIGAIGGAAGSYATGTYHRNAVSPCSQKSGSKKLLKGCMTDSAPDRTYGELTRFLHYRGCNSLVVDYYGVFIHDFQARMAATRSSDNEVLFFFSGWEPVKNS